VKAQASPAAAAPAPGRRRDASSPWSSEEGRAFLQERVAHYSLLCFVITAIFFVAGWGVAVLWTPDLLQNWLSSSLLLHLGSAVALLAMWLATRGGPLPAGVLLLVEGGGLVIASWAMTGNAFTIPVVLRPDLVAVVSLFGLLLYRAAVVPSDARRTAWIGILACLPVPLLTYFVYTRRHVPGTPPAVAYTAYEILFAALVVVLSAKTSSVIYGLRQTISEARRLGPYTLESKIGEGGMGAVYRARHALLRRPTAVKILPPERAGEMDLARFEREVQMTSLLTSPHTVAIYDFGRTPDGLFYYAMEFLDGIDLQELVSRDGPMPASRVVHVLRQVCEALGEAHRVGLIHRDIKPANILLCERRGRADVAKVVDFGLVKDLAAVAGPGATREDIVLGTPHYLSPEALKTPDRIDARSDIYALGATAYYLLTGTPVFEGSLPQIFADHISKMPEPPSSRSGRTVPPDLERAVLAALAKDPNDRPESVDEFDGMLAACSVPPWTDADASAWWRTRGARLRALRAGAAAPEPASSEQQTMEVGGRA
jgi:serine/threonine-protein kinase